MHLGLEASWLHGWGARDTLALGIVCNYAVISSDPKQSDPWSPLRMCCLDESEDLTINVRVFEQVLRRLNWIYAGADDHKSLGQGSVIIRWTTLSKAWFRQP